MRRRIATLNTRGIELPKHVRILDFGCGDGRTVYSLRDQGYPNVYDYDIYERLEIRHPDDRAHFFIADRAAGAGCRSTTTVSTSLFPRRCLSM